MKVALYLLGSLIGRMPIRGARGIGRFLGWFLGSFVRYRRADVLDSLARSLPEQTPARHREIARRMYSNLGLTFVENLRLAYGSGERLLDSASTEGFDLLRDVLAQGNGALILTGHIGNWELAGFSLRRHGFPVSVVIKEIKGAVIEDYVTRMRTRHDIHLIPRQDSYRTCRKVLKENGVLVFMMDQNMIRAEGVFVEFFGRPACTTPGLAHLSASTGAPVVPAFCFREADGEVRLRVYPALPPPPGCDKETIHAATQEYTRVLEDVIREHPEQWIWIHRRWRTRAPALPGSSGPEPRSKRAAAPAGSG